MSLSLSRDKHPAFWSALGWTLGTKAVLFVVGWFAFAILPTNHTNHRLFPIYANIWGRWDTAWFVRVAAQGYLHGWPQNPAFFPLYPAMIRLGTILDPKAPTIVAPLLSAWIASFFVFYWLLKLVRLDGDQAKALRVVKIAALFPTAFFLSVAYSEAPFIALVLGAFYTARRGQWLWTALLGFLAALTRNEGVLLFFPFLWEYCQQFGYRIRYQIIGLIGAPLGLIAYMAYLQAIGKGAFDMLKAEKLGWHRKTVPPWQGLHVALSTLLHHPHMSSTVFIYTSIDLTSALLLMAATVYMIVRHYRWSYVIWSALMVLIPLSSVTPPFYSPILSMSRLIMPAFPLYIVLAEWGESSPFWDGVASYLFPATQALFYTFWVLFFWIA